MKMCLYSSLSITAMLIYSFTSTTTLSAMPTEDVTQQMDADARDVFFAGIHTTNAMTAHGGDADGAVYGRNRESSRSERDELLFDFKQKLRAAPTVGVILMHLRRALETDKITPDEETVRIALSVFDDCGSGDGTLRHAEDVMRLLRSAGAPIPKEADETMTALRWKNTLFKTENAAGIVQSLRLRSFSEKWRSVYEYALVRCAQLRAATEAQEVFRMMTETGFPRTLASYNNLLLALSERKEFAADQWRYFEQMTGEERMQPNDRTLRAMLAMWRKNDAFVAENATRIADALSSKWRNVTHDEHWELQKNVMLRRVRQIESEKQQLDSNKMRPLIEPGHAPEVGARIDACASVECVELELSHFNPKSISMDVYHRAMEKFISFGNCHDKRSSERILEMFAKMRVFQIGPERETYRFLFRAFASSGKLSVADVLNILRRMTVIDQMRPDEETVRIALSVVERNGKDNAKARNVLRLLADGGAPITKEEADDVMARIGHRNAVKVKARVSACQSAACVVQTLRPLSSHTMLQSATRPFNKFICEELQRIYDIALLRCVEFKAATEAQEVFRKMAEEGIPRTVTSYNRLLSALAMRKELAAEQWRYFEQMTGESEERIQPNEETLIAMLAMWRGNGVFVADNAMRIADALSWKWRNVTLSTVTEFQKKVLLARVQPLQSANALTEPSAKYETESDSEESLVLGRKSSN